MEPPIVSPGMATRSTSTPYLGYEPIPEAYPSGYKLVKVVLLGLGITVAQFALLIFLMSLAGRH